MSSAAVLVALPTLLRAIEARDMETIHASFTPDAAIVDEGEAVHGRAGVERWATRVLGYAPTFTIDGMGVAAVGWVVASRVRAAGWLGSGRRACRVAPG